MKIKSGWSRSWEKRRSRRRSARKRRMMGDRTRKHEKKNKRDMNINKMKCIHILYYLTLV
jgi:hypothetical protein